MIKVYEELLTPNQAAKEIISDALDQSLHDWLEHTYPGESLAQNATEREIDLVQDQINKLLKRIYKIV
tara:strand:- start:352 stop:555 length:204 start_codon:yes stop_codon:yes gene_type:complete